jgi:hypothetical protein
MIITRAGLHIKRRIDLESEQLQSICLELEMQKRNWGILFVYRPPSLSDTTFESNITICLDKMLMNFDNLLTICDINYDLLKQEKSKTILNIMDSFDLVNLVKKPTCHKKTLQTLLLQMFFSLILQLCFVARQFSIFIPRRVAGRGI